MAHPAAVTIRRAVSGDEVPMVCSKPTASPPRTIWMPNPKSASFDDCFMRNPNLDVYCRAGLSRQRLLFQSTVGGWFAAAGPRGRELFARSAELGREIRVAMQLRNGSCADVATGVNVALPMHARFKRS